jgi:hypothetical protein
MDYPLKTIQYNQGYASFRIPAHWVEEVEKEGRLHFYDDASDDVFSLRVSIITAEPPDGMVDPSTEDLMNACGIPDYAEKLMIDSNNLIAIHNAREDFDEDNEHYIVHYWEYIHKKPNGQFDLAMFTWSMDATLEHNSAYDNFIHLIGEEAKNLKFND